MECPNQRTSCTRDREGISPQGRRLRRIQRYAVSKVPQFADGEVRRIEADILKDVVVHAVVIDAEAAAHHQFLISESVARKPEARTKIVQVLVPQVVVSLLH